MATPTTQTSAAQSSQMPQVTVSSPDPFGNSITSQFGTSPPPAFSPPPAMQDPGMSAALDPSILTENFGSSSTSGSSDTTNSSGSSLGSVLSGLTSGTGLNTLIGLGSDAAIAGYGLSSASSAQNQTQQQANQILGPSNALLNAGNQQLSQFQSQTLTPTQQQFVNFASEEGQNIIASGGAMQTIANQYLGDFSSGKLNPADQMQLDQNTAAQKQQVAQMLSSGGIQDSSVLAAYNQQIDNQAMVQKQTILNGYFQTGDTAYNQWLTSNQQGTQIMAMGAQYAQTAFQDMMQNALGLEGAGMAGLTTAVGLVINGDTAVQGQLSQLMTNLASAATYQLTGGGPGRAGSPAGGTANPLGSILNTGKTANSAYNNLSNLYNSYQASNLGSSIDAAFNSDLPNILSNTAPAAIDTSADVATSLGDFSAAGGEAAAGLQQVGTGAIDAAANSAGADASSAITASGSGTAAASAGSGAMATAGTALGVAGGAYGLYNFAENYQSGATGSDAAMGAETGASIGTAVMPGIGTAVGAVIGGAVGALASAFGPGRTDPETGDWNQYLTAFGKQPQIAGNLQNPFLLMAGLFDERSSTMPFYQQYGRMGENKFTVDMTQQINNAVESGKVPPNATPAQVYSQVVSPWVASMGSGWSNVGPQYTQASQALLQRMTQQYMQGQYQNWKAVGGDYNFGNSIQPYAGANASIGAQPSQVSSTTSQPNWAM